MLQALIEKQFPAADRRKVADLFALNSDSRDKILGRSPPASRPGTPKKRKQQGQSVVLHTHNITQCNATQCNTVQCNTINLICGWGLTLATGLCGLAENKI